MIVTPLLAVTVILSASGTALPDCDSILTPQCEVAVTNNDIIADLFKNKFL
jgi:hypothetical protein